jgi:hypothetical protein
VLLISVGCSLSLAAYALTRFIPPRPYGLADDYRVFFAAARLLGGGHSPYDWGKLQAVEQLAQFYSRLPTTLDSFANLPIAATLLEPLSKLPFWASYIAFTCFGAATALLMLALLARDLGWTRVAALVLGVLVSWIARLGFAAGPFDALMFAVLAGSMLLAWHDRPFLAGLVVALIWVKPDLLWPAPVFLFLVLWQRPRRAWWFAVGFAAVSALCLAASSGLLPAWWRAAHGFASGVGTQQPDLAGLPGLLRASPAGSGLGTGVLAPGTLVVIAGALVGMAVFAAWMMLSSDWRQVSPVGRIAWGGRAAVGDLAAGNAIPPPQRRSAPAAIDHADGGPGRSARAWTRLGPGAAGDGLAAPDLLGGGDPRGRGAAGPGRTRGRALALAYQSALHRLRGRALPSRTGPAAAGVGVPPAPRGAHLDRGLGLGGGGSQNLLDGGALQ